MADNSDTTVSPQPKSEAPVAEGQQGGAEGGAENQGGQAQGNDAPAQGQLPSRDDLPDELKPVYDEIIKAGNEKFRAASEMRKEVEAIKEKAAFYDKLQQYGPYQEWLAAQSNPESGQPKVPSSQQSADLPSLYQRALGDEDGKGMAEYVTEVVKPFVDSLKSELEQARQELGNLRQNQQLLDIARQNPEVYEAQRSGKLDRWLHKGYEVSDAYKLYKAETGSGDPVAEAERLLEQRRNAATLKPTGTPVGRAKVVYVNTLEEKQLRETMSRINNENVRYEIKKDG